MPRSLQLLLVLLMPLLAWASPVDRPLRIGVISPLSGDFSAVGTNMVQGVELARDELATERKFELIIEDDRFDPKSGLGAYKKLRDVHHIDALINLSSPTIASIYPLITHDGIPVLQFGEQPQEPVKDNVFGMFPSSLDPTAALGRYLSPLYSRVVILYSEDPTVLRFVDTFAAQFKGTSERVSLGVSAEVRLPVLKVLGGKPEAIVLYLAAQQGALATKEIVKYAKRPRPALVLPFLASSLSEYQTLFGDLAPLYGDIAIRYGEKAHEDFKRRFHAKFGANPGMAAPEGYDALKLLHATFQPEKSAWVERIRYASLEGVSGSITFNEQGGRKGSFEIATIRELFGAENKK